MSLYTWTFKKFLPKIHQLTADSNSAIGDEKHHGSEKDARFELKKQKCSMKSRQPKKDFFVVALEGFENTTAS